MLQEFVIRVESNEPARQLLESAIQNELKTIQHGINRTRDCLAAFEKQYAMATEEFLRRFTKDDLGETMDFIDWYGETKMLALLEEQKRALEGAQVS